MQETLVETKLTCYHCGDVCPPKPLMADHKPFCCEGCSMVYELLSHNGLCAYYELEKQPGLKIKSKAKEQYAYLEQASITDLLLDFKEKGLAKVTFQLPAMHCSSCIWLLENLPKLKEGILTSRVQFTRKEISLSFQPELISLREVVELLDSVGYPPLISLEQTSEKPKSAQSNRLVFQLGVAGFCSANIMLFSFPEYFGLSASEYVLSHLFGYLNLCLSIPVIFYCASDYFISAYKGLMNKALNLDVPIALGMAAIFLRSAYEVLFLLGPGYFDSLTGLVFFLLIGKWYQRRTYSGFSFDRDYQSYFPIAITKLEGEKEVPTLVKEIKEGDVLLVRNQEIIPADAILESEEASIDYSFVTGESLPVGKRKGDLVYAGGKQVGSSIRLRTEKAVSQSYLIQLWDQDVFKKGHDAYLSSFVLLFSRYFVYGTLLIAIATCLYWLRIDSSKLLFALTSVLLVACPCALALSLPFALGNALRWLGKYGLYMKNADAVEKLAEVDTLVFDKTGTLTQAENGTTEFFGDKLSPEETAWVKSTCWHSVHPLSQSIYQFLPGSTILIDTFAEIPNKGISARIGKQEIKLGSAGFLGVELARKVESTVHLTIDGVYKGYFCVQQHCRPGVEEVLKELGKKYDLHLVSGDNDRESAYFSKFFPSQNVAFHQKPADKLAYVQSLKDLGKKPLMIGDGLNDAGALKAAELGISVSEQSTYFSPACDGILQGAQVKQLLAFLRFASGVKKTVLFSLVLSLLYNFAGFYFAVRGELSPLIAAILMPLSSFTVVLFVVISTNVLARKLTV